MTDHDQPDQPGTLISRITITRWLNPNGEDIITTDRGDCSRLEVLGILTFAQHSVWTADQRADDQDPDQ